MIIWDWEGQRKLPGDCFSNAGMLKELRLQPVSKVSVLWLAGLIAHLSWRLIVLQWLESSRRDVKRDH
jgi:hypothetical protein